MLNQVILVGRVKSINKDNEQTVITLSIALNYKEVGENEYGTDEVAVTLSNHLSATALEYLNEDATLGIKARFQMKAVKVDVIEIKTVAVIAEKLTFINSKKD
ncbi:hypothetical protein CI105_08930 [Candidatus Izimaplasma bacterium ZiA1]|uniref:hypothetical protein n=1 Tax=Candidatus Izimoplasma sp. ZiA1 TaxID=2024899 RepID=UPI000BAA87B3|nr:hypothetical protein CI105_08930 [Candidatus Izimaplasma bacterium ZiA1]